MGLAALAMLIACGSSKEPFVFPDPPDNSENPPATSNPIGDCFVNFQSMLQLKVSANPAGEELEVLDSNPIAIANIPIEVKGNEIAIAGELFPDIVLTRLSESADLRFGGVHGGRSAGTYDPASGAMIFPEMQFTLEVLQKGKADRLLDGEVVIGNLELTTGAVTAQGNLRSISETGQPLKPEDKSLTLVFGTTLPNDFSPLVPLNEILGGGALTASFSGTLDNMPDQCGAPGGSGEPPPGQEQPEGLHISVAGQVETSRIDFGLASVVLRKNGEQDQIDCSDAGFRGQLSKMVTVKNVSSVPKTLAFEQPKDRDADIKAPLCSGGSEFVRGSVGVGAGASCETVKVGGREFPIGRCTLAPDAEITFPMMYLPYNYQAPPDGFDPILDSGEFLLEHGGAAPFRIALSGRTIPDVRDVFSVSKVNNGIISPKEIRNKGSLKIALQQDVAIPYTQKVVLKNSGGDIWEEVKVEFEKGTAFSGTIPTLNRLEAAQTGVPGKLEFDLVLNPGAEPVVSDVMTIRMVKIGSRTESNPVGIEARIVINLLGTVGVPKLTGTVRMQFDFLTALIDHSIIDEPLKSIDYRPQPELAPEPLILHFSDSADPDYQNVDLEAHVVDILDPNLSKRDRERLLRIFTSRASVGINGERLDSGDGSDQCREAEKLNVPYRNGDCSYFYHNILSSDPGLYDSDTGHFTLPSIQLRMENPYHADILGRWPASNPLGNPDYMMDVTLHLSFTTHLLDRRMIQEGGREIVLVPDDRISERDLEVKDKRLGQPCPEGYLDNVQPYLQCYLSTGNRHFQGYEVTLKAGQTKYYDVVIVGVAQFPPGGPDTSNPDLPWFLGDSGGSRFYIAIQGRMYQE
ncbi:MAG TPA: hypothetical protein VJP40_06695 [bacterium]|nr:hypothetical protein [bacterium]